MSSKNKLDPASQRNLAKIAKEINADNFWKFWQSQKKPSAYEVSRDLKKPIISNQIFNKMLKIRSSER